MIAPWIILVSILCPIFAISALYGLFLLTRSQDRISFGHEDSEQEETDSGFVGQPTFTLRGQSLPSGTDLCDSKRSIALPKTETDSASSSYREHRVKQGIKTVLDANTLAGTRPDSLNQIHHDAASDSVGEVCIDGQAILNLDLVSDLRQGGHESRRPYTIHRDTTRDSASIYSLQLDDDHLADRSSFDVGDVVEPRRRSRWLTKKSRYSTFLKHVSQKPKFYVPSGLSQSSSRNSVDLSAPKEDIRASPVEYDDANCAHGQVDNMEYADPVIYSMMPESEEDLVECEYEDDEVDGDMETSPRRLTTINEEPEMSKQSVVKAEVIHARQQQLISPVDVKGVHPEADRCEESNVPSPNMPQSNLYTFL